MPAMPSKSILGKLTCSVQFILIEKQNLGLVGPTGKFADSQTLSKKLVTAFITKLLHVLASAHMPSKLKLSSAPQLTHLKVNSGGIQKRLDNATRLTEPV